ncbi:MAG TPA: SIS domain-containing protein [Candidatus Acidoferrum sp.]|nr:SIS domain-containing protein [Candidatus Acidoferrum sp.]
MQDILGQEKSLGRVLERQTGAGRAAMLEAAWSLGEAAKVVITGIGASLHSAYPLHYALAGRGMNCSIVEIAELLHYQERICAGAVVVIFSRSGESIEVVKLLEKVKGVASRVMAITNEPESTLAKRADVTIFVDSLADEIVAVQSYTGGVAAGLLLAGAVGDEFDARVAEVSACLPQITVLIRESLERVAEWDSFVKAGAAIYFLGRGDSVASALEASLLIGETAKEAAIGMAAASFRHGPVEVVDENYRAVIFAGPGATRGINLALARELAKRGGRIRVIGAGGEDAAGLSLIGLPSVADAMLPLVEIVPVQIAAMRFAFVKGLEIGKFRHTGQVTTDEVAF